MSLAEHMAAYPDLSPLIEAHLPMTFIRHTLCRQFIEAIITSHSRNTPVMDVIREQDDEELLSKFAARVQSAPQKLTSREVNPGQALQDMILYIHRREIKRARQALEQSEQANESHVQQKLREYTHDLKMLGSWETGEPVLEIICDQAEDISSAG
jgi:hypothetical protein